MEDSQPARHIIINKIRDTRSKMIKDSRMMREESKNLEIRADQAMIHVRQLTALIELIEAM